MEDSPIKMYSDEKLVLLLREGNEEILDEMFNRYWEKLFRYAEKVLLDEAAAKDIVQDVFVDIWERRERLTIRNLNAYLTQAVKYQISSYLRKDKFQTRHEEVLDTLVSGNNTEDMIHAKELNREILDTLKNVPPRSRNVFYLSRYEHFTNQEIADQLNISIRTVETHISKALAHLRKHLKPSVLLLLLSILG